MDRKELEAVRKNNAAIVQDICAQYGLYGNVVFYEPSPMSNSSMNRMYIVAGLDPEIAKYPLPKKYRPDEMLHAIQRNEKLFYPQAWVLDLKEVKDELSATEYLVEYCKKAGFMARLYAEYGLSAPKALRVSEVYQLMNFRDGLDNPRATSRMLENIGKTLIGSFEGRQPETSSVVRGLIIFAVKNSRMIRALWPKSLVFSKGKSLRFLWSS